MIATLCENLDSLDEPEARAAMIWIVGEYAERIDNADELLESFLEGFHDESTQVRRWVAYLGTCGPSCPETLLSARRPQGPAPPKTALTVRTDTGVSYGRQVWPLCSHTAVPKGDM